jgi:hypothetical protein
MLASLRNRELESRYRTQMSLLGSLGGVSASAVLRRPFALLAAARIAHLAGP